MTTAAKGLVTGFLNSFLVDFIEEIDKSSLSFEGIGLRLNDVKIKKDSLKNLGLPFVIQKGYVGGLSGKLGSISKVFQLLDLEFSLQDLFILAKLESSVYTDVTEPANVNEFDKYCQEIGSEAHQNLGKYMIDTIKALRGTAKDIHVRLEFQRGSKIIAFGVMIKIIDVICLDHGDAVKHGFKEEKSIYKKLKITDFSIYMDIIDPNNSIKVDDKFNSNMQISDDHQFILKNLSFEGYLEHRVDEGTNNLILDTKLIDLGLDGTQWLGLLKLNKEYMNFSKILLYQCYGRPSSPPRSERSSTKWFVYAHNCAIAKKNANKFKVSEALLFLKNRKAMVNPIVDFLRKDVKDRKKDSKFKALKEKFPKTVFDSLIEYAKKENYKAQLSKIKSNNVKVEENQMNSENGKMDITLHFDALSFALKHSQTEPIAIFSISDIGIKFKHDKSGNSGKATMQRIILTNGIKNTNVFTLSMENSDGVSVYFDQSIGSMKLATSIASPIINADIPLFLAISDFFDGCVGYLVDPNATTKQKKAATTLIINHLIETKIYFDLNVELSSPQIIIPTEHPIKVNLGTLKISSDNEIKPKLGETNTYYDRYILKLSNLSALVGTETLIKPINFELNLSSLFVPFFDIPSMICESSMDDVVVCLKQSYLKELMAFLVYDTFDFDKAVDVFNFDNEPTEILQISSRPANSVLAQRTVSEVDSNQGFSMFNFLFKRFNITLLREDNSIQNMFDIINMVAGITLKGTNLDATFILKTINATQSNSESFFSFGNMDIPAVDFTFQSEHFVHNKFALNCNQPMIEFDFGWVGEIISFFDLSDPNKLQPVVTETPVTLEEDNQQSVIIPNSGSKDLTFNGAFRLVNPSISMPFPLVDGTTQSIQFGIGNICCDVIYSNGDKSAKCSIDSVHMFCNERKILDFSTNVSFDMMDGIDIDGRMTRIDITPLRSDYYFALGVANYVTASIQNLFGPGENESTKNESNEIQSKEEEEKKEKEGNNLVMKFELDGIRIGIESSEINVGNIGVNIGNDNSTSIVVNSMSVTDTNLKHSVVDIKTPIAVSIKDIIDVSVGDIVMSPDTVMVAPIIEFFRRNVSVVKIPETKKPKVVVADHAKEINEDKSSSVMEVNVKTGEIVFQANDNGEKVAELKFRVPSVKFINGRPEGMLLDLNLVDLWIGTNVIPHILNLPFVDLKIDGSNMDISTGLIKAFYHHQIVMEQIVPRFLGMIPQIDNGKEEKETEQLPTSLPLYNYKINIDGMDMTLLTKQAQRPIITLNTSRINGITSKDMQNIDLLFDSIVIAVKESQFLKTENFKVGVNLGVSHSYPPMINGNSDSNPKVDNSTFFLHKLSFGIDIPHSFELTVTNKMCSSIAHYLMTILNPNVDVSPDDKGKKIQTQEKPKAPPKYRLDMAYSVTSKHIALIYENDYSITLKSIKFAMDKDIIVEFGAFEFSYGGNVLKMLEEDSFKMVMGDQMKIDVTSLNGVVNIDSVVVMLNKMMENAFYTTNFSVPSADDNPQPVITEGEAKPRDIMVSLDSINIEIPIADGIPLNLNVQAIVKFEKNEAGMKVGVDRIYIAFKDGENIMPLTAGLSTEFCSTENDKHHITSVKTTCIVMSLTTGHIASMMYLANSLSSALSKLTRTEEKGIEYLSPETQELTKTKPKKVQRYMISIGQVELNLELSQKSSGVNIPFVRLTFDPISADIILGNQNSVINIRMDLFAIYNSVSNDWDSVVEPFNARLLLQNAESLSTQRLIIADTVECHISARMLKQINFFMSEIDRRYKEKSFTQENSAYVKFQNLTSFNAKIKNESFEKEVAPLGVISTESGSNTKHVISVGNFTIPVALSFNDLVYPFTMTPTTVIYKHKSLEGDSIILSASVVFENLSKLPLMLSQRQGWKKYIHYSFINEGRIPIPFSASLDDKFALTDGSEKSKSDDHNVFTIKDITSKPTEIVVKYFKEKIRFLISPKHQIDTGITVCRITTGGVLKNELPFTVIIGFNQKVHEIKSGASIPVSCLGLMNSEAFFDDKKAVPIKMDDGVVPIRYKGSKIAISTILDNGMWRFTVFAPAVILNKSGLKFDILDEKNKLHRFDENNMMMLSHKSIYNSKDANTIKIKPVVNEGISGNLIECLVNTAADSYMIPLAEGEDKFMPVRVQAKKNGLSHTVIFRAGLDMVNRTDVPIRVVLEELGTSWELEPGKSVPAFESNMDMKYIFMIGKDCAHVGLGSPARYTISLGGRLLEIGIQPVDSRMIVSISDAKPLSPVVIQNDTCYTIRSNQAGFLNPFQDINPYSSTPVSFVDTTVGRGLTLSIGEKSVNFDPFSINSHVTLGDTIITIRKHKSGSKFIIVSKEALAPPKQSLMFLELELSKLRLSIIDKYYFETTLLSLNDFSFAFSQCDKESVARLSISRFTLDDMHPRSTFKTMATSGNSNKLFLDVKLSMHAGTPLFTAYKTVAIQVAPITINLESSALTDTMAIIADLFEGDEKEKDKSEERDEPAPSQTITVDNMRIGEINATLTFQKTATRVGRYPVPSFAMKMIPEITNFEIKTPVVGPISFDGTVAYVQSNVLNPIVASVKWQLLKIFFNLDILGNLGGIGRGLRSDAENGQYILMVPTAGLRLTENVLNTASSIMRAITSDNSVTGVGGARIGVNQSAGETVKSGFVSFGSSFVDGFGGIINDPLEGAKKDGAIGFIKGLVTGTTGIITKPVKGTIDLGTSLITGLRKIASEDVIYAWERNPLVIARKTITPYNDRTAKLQELIVEKSKNHEAGHIEVIAVTSKEMMVALTPFALFVNKGNRIEEIEYCDIKEGPKLQDSCTVAFKGHSFKFSNNADARNVYIYMLSKVLLTGN